MLSIIKSGFYSTVQDQGRFGYRQYGVPVSGAMDLYSSQFANALLGNTHDSAVIEMTMVGGVFKFSKPTIIVVSGADMSPILNERPVRQNRIINIKSNDILTFGKVKKGFRSYLAIKGGFKSDVFLGSRSQYVSITSSQTVVKNDRLNYDNLNKEYKASNALLKFDDSILTFDLLEAFAGPEFNCLSNEQKAVLFNSDLVVSNQNNRMAYQLEPLFKNNLDPILTSPVLPGTVQLTPKGNLIILMRDSQTTGGYSRILQLTEKSINILSQKNTGNSLRLRLNKL